MTAPADKASSEGAESAAATETMLPCPFCGETDVDATFALNGEGQVSAGCMVCCMTGPESNSARDAAERWNALPRRAVPESGLNDALLRKVVAYGTARRDKKMEDAERLFNELKAAFARSGCGTNNAAGQATNVLGQLQQKAEGTASGLSKETTADVSQPAPAAPATPRTARPVMSEGNLSGWSVYVTSLERYIDQLERLLDQREKQLIKAQGDLIERNHELFVARSATQPRHWVYAAAEAHRPLLANWSTVTHGATGPDHVRWMLDKIRDGGFSPTKACRWLGWVQAALNMDGVSLDTLKAINKAASDAFVSATQERVPLSTTKHA